MSNIKNVAVIGYPYSEAVELIAKLEKMTDNFFLIPETIGDPGHLKSINFSVGMNGKKITLFGEASLDIFLKYHKLTIVDFNPNDDRKIYSIRNRIRYIPIIIREEENVNIEQIISSI